jgi:hypothetical protein
VIGNGGDGGNGGLFGNAVFVGDPGSGGAGGLLLGLNWMNGLT